jgi:hypothetical protein
MSPSAHVSAALKSQGPAPRSYLHRTYSRDRRMRAHISTPSLRYLLACCAFAPSHRWVVLLCVWCRRDPLPTHQSRWELPNTLDTLSDARNAGPDHDYSAHSNRSGDATALRALERAVQVSKRPASDVILLSFSKSVHGTLTGYCAPVA